MAKLTAAFAKGADHPDFQALLDARGFKKLSLSGAEAEAFLTGWQQRTTWLIWDAGLAKVSPDSVGIAKP